jgi:hypothetical protein
MVLLFLQHIVVSIISQNDCLPLSYKKRRENFNKDCH